MKILVLNAGSSSLKYQVIDMTDEKVLCKGVVERIGLGSPNVNHKKGETKFFIENVAVKDHTDAFGLVLSVISDKEKGVLFSIDEISAIGHRVLHGGEDFTSSVLVTPEVLAICKKNTVLGPLHMPANISCIESCIKLKPNIPNVAVFDTVFHSTMPDYAYMYAIKYEDYEKYKIRKYGFHGTSHKYVSGEAVKYLGNPAKSRIITCHLGNGSSIAAVKDGRCIDTSMGLTPLEGMIMGTRSGDIDAAAVEFLCECKNITVQEATRYLNKECGFMGLSGYSDNRDLIKKYFEGDPKAILCVNMFVYRIKKYIGSYYAALGGLDCLVFTGGIGENARYTREFICNGLDIFGVGIDHDKNMSVPGGEFSDLTKEGCAVKTLIIPTNEELVIARDTRDITQI